MKIHINKSGKLLSGIAAVMALAAAITAMSCKASVTNANVSNAPATPSPVQKCKVALEKTAGGNVTVTPALPDDGMVNKGTNLTFTATALTGYELEKWECNGSAVNGQALSYTLTVNEAANVKVFFKTNGKPITKRTVTLTDPVHGTVTSVPEIPPDKQLPEGTEITFTAKADAGYVVDKWTVTPSEALKTGGTEGSETATVKVTADTTVTVPFKTVAPPSAPSDKTYTVGTVSFTMKGIAAVTNKKIGDDSYSDNKEHSISLSAYLIGETEVTQDLWQAVMGNNPSCYYGSPALGEVQEKRPVECVSWYQCVAFCNELTKKVNGGAEGECAYYSNRGCTTVYTKGDDNNNTPAYQKMDKKGFRLPTEAEWEWAAMGGKSDKWAGTNTESELKDYAWYAANSNNTKTHQVKRKSPNGYKLYGMSGNVNEWCWDLYGLLPDPMQADYTGADFGACRVVRGGDGNNDADAAARARRQGFLTPGNQVSNLGLRVVCRP